MAEHRLLSPPMCSWELPRMQAPPRLLSVARVFAHIAELVCARCLLLQGATCSSAFTTATSGA